MSEQCEDLRLAGGIGHLTEGQKNEPCGLTVAELHEVLARESALREEVERLKNEAEENKLEWYAAVRDMRREVERAEAAEVRAAEAEKERDEARSEAVRVTLRGLPDAYRAGWEAARERAIGKIQLFLCYDSQRAVSWHEVRDCLEAVRALEPEGEK